jgi:putative resolvase
MSTTEKLLTPEEARKILCISRTALLEWSRQGKYTDIRTAGGHRRYKLSEIKPGYQEPKPDKRNICYCRVSTRSQKQDLDRQIEFFQIKYPNHEIISDIGSGINFKRKGLNTILDQSIKGNIGEIVVTHRDRLCRFGFDLIERIIQTHSDGKIVVLDQQETSPQEELVNDIISIITVFSSRLYGLRSHEIKNKLREIKNNKNKDVSNTEGTGETQNDDVSI